MTCKRKAIFRTNPMKKSKRKAREYFIVESEYGWDIKRYIKTVCSSELEALKFSAYLDARNPGDKHEVVRVREVLKK